MVTITNAGLAWYNNRATSDTTPRLDTVAVGDGTDAEDPARTSLQSELYRDTDDTSIVDFVDGDDPTLTYATITLRGSLEIPSGSEVTEVGVIASGSPDTLVWYGTVSAVPFESSDENTIRVPMDLMRVVGEQ